jgi:hypothetical protein
MHWYAQRRIFRSRYLAVFCVIFLLLAGSPPADRAANRIPGAASDEHRATDPRPAESSKSTCDDAIPAGTILPVVLPSISSKSVKKGDKIRGKLAQDVRLQGGKRIRGGTNVFGSVVDIGSGDAGRGATVTIKFDRLVQRGESTSIRTHLRAMATTVAIEQAQIPTSGPGESDVYDWLTTVQVGGDVVYGKQGPVERGTRVLGESTYDGVFVRTLASADGRCRGSVYGNDWPQALWVFSADACGLYGFPNLEIRHVGRTEPLGEIVLESKRGPVRIRGGSGVLLRIDGCE